jgi:hypothetical protein
MRVLFMTTLIAAAGACAVAAAQPRVQAPSDSAVLCLDGLGVNHPPICHSSTASRLSPEPDICSCRGPYQQVKTNWCASGETPPADTADFDRARLAAVKNGALYNFMWQGKRACVPLGPNG